MCVCVGGEVTMGESGWGGAGSVCVEGKGLGRGGGQGGEGRGSQLEEVQGEETGEGGRAEVARAASPSPQTVPG